MLAGFGITKIRPLDGLELVLAYKYGLWMVLQANITKEDAPHGILGRKMPRDLYKHVYILIEVSTYRLKLFTY